MDLLNLVVKLIFDDGDYDDKVDDIKDQAEQLGENIKSSMGDAIDAIKGAVEQAASLTSGIVKQSVDQYGEYEQLVGGIETLFGEGAAQVIDDAKTHSEQPRYRRMSI
jgi:hypothetical protein